MKSVHSTLYERNIIGIKTNTMKKVRTPGYWGIHSSIRMKIFRNTWDCFYDYLETQLNEDFDNVEISEIDDLS